MPSLKAGFGEDRILSFFRALAKDSESATIYFQGGVRAAKLKAPIVDGRIHHALVNDVESGIAESRLNGVRAIPLLKIYLSASMNAWSVVQTFIAQ